MELNKHYSANEIEKKWYSFWLENGHFKAKKDPDKKPFAQNLLNERET